jgi:TonB-linked SusC/RagA family outer membrane protein
MRAVRLTLLSLVLFFVGAASAAAQQSGTITGQVTDAATGQPLAGVQMQVAGTNVGGLTDQNGRFLITRVPAGEQTIRAVLIGYAQATQAVSVTAGGTATANFSLETSAVPLEGLVVTATGERQRTREVGASIGKIDVDEIPLAVNTDVSSVLQARAPGVTVMQAGGTTGTGSRIRIRGSASVSLDNDPLIIVDGVRASNSTGNSIGVGGQNVSRLNDFSAEDIENIEILKGPAASALYGTAAANGVIVITTKKGAAGDTRWSAYVERGSLVEPNDYPTNYVGYCSYYSASTGAKVGDIPGCDTAYFYDLQDAYAGVFDFQQDSIQSFNPLNSGGDISPFQDGMREKYGISASGGSERVTYFLSGDWEHEEGVYEDVSDLENLNLRANLSSQLTEQLDVSVQTGFINSDLRLPENDNNVLGILPSAFFGGGTEDDAYGFFRLDDLKAIDTKQRVERFIGSVQGNYRPLTWLSFNSTVGMDVINRWDNQTIPPQRVFFSDLPEGQRTSNRIQISTYTGNLNGSAEFMLRPNIASNTDVGVQFTQEVFEGTYAFGRGLLAGCFSLNCVATGFSVDEVTTDVRTAGAYLSQQFALNDRLFLTGTIRADDNSAFGEDLDLTLYPSVNLSWVAAEEPWFPEIEALSLLRLRTGYGEAGLQPGFRSATRFLSPQATTISGQVIPSFSFGGIGNPDLKPEISKEFEIGADVGLFDDRLGLELTYYNKKSEDALVSRDLAPSLGVATSQVINIGEVQNKGIEALATMLLANTANVQWDATVSYSTNDNELVDLGIDPTTGEDIEPIIFGLGANTQRHQEGFPLGGYWQRPYTFEDSNADGIIQIGEVELADTAEYLGSPFPGREMSFQSSVTLFNLVRISGLLDHKGDFKLFNGTADFRCASFYNCRQAFAGYGDLDVSLEDQAAYVADAYGNAGGTVAGFIEDGDFWKLRELAATLMLPSDWAQRFGADAMNLTFAGRNLATWTDYSGPDPEINFGGSGANFITADFLSQPPIRYYTVRLDVNF